ncbi:MAG: helix-turn-helix domain-containing protein [Eubacterium sp.]|nr:helix-turn-helix domain-containing protein [Eubacterium sp.]
MKKIAKKKNLKYLNDEMITCFGKRVAELRKEKGITANQMAEDLDMSAANLSMIERGEQFCKIDNIILIAQYLETSIDHLIYGYEEEGIVGWMRMIIQQYDRKDVEKALYYFQASLDIETEVRTKASNTMSLECENEKGGKGYVRLW